MDDSLLQRYSRHILLDDIGIDGQERLAAAHVLVVGAGGLGCPAALYLAAAGVGRLTLCDDDVVDLTNLQRQILHGDADVGRAKVESAQQSLAAVNPHCHVLLRHEKIGEHNAAELVAAADVILDCCDNYGTRHLINRHCTAQKKPLVFGAALGFEGQMTVFDTRAERSPCYNCLFDENDCAPETRCALMGVFAPLVGMIGCLQAAEAIKLIAMRGVGGLVGRLLLLDGRRMVWRDVEVPRDPRCRVCSGAA